MGSDSVVVERKSNDLITIPEDRSERDDQVEIERGNVWREYPILSIPEEPLCPEPREGGRTHRGPPT